MITNQCMSHNYTSCSDKTMRLKDDRGNDFVAVSNCSQCYSTIYNKTATSMIDKMEEIEKDCFFIDFTIENEFEAEAVLKSISDIENVRVSTSGMGKRGTGIADMENRKAVIGKQQGINRGHHYRGVD